MSHKTREIKINIIRPSSREHPNLLDSSIDFLSQKGFQIKYHETPTDPTWPCTASSIQNRKKQLEKALLDKKTNIILAARGGYGASDLLPLLNWKKLKTAKEKLLVGFSDISALHSALYTKLSWRGLHAPMPASELWNVEKPDSSILQTLDILRGKNITPQLPLELIHSGKSKKKSISGKLFGGCFSVLTNLIGTPFFPRSLKNHIVFLEDIQETPGRLMRFLNQWDQSGALRGISALILGRFVKMGDDSKKEELWIHEVGQRFLDFPIYRTHSIGHIANNIPMMIGVEATIEQNFLRYQFP